MIGRWIARLGIRPSERRLVLRFTALHFLIIASYTLARAARDVMFLDTLTSKGLPYLYVAVAMWTALVSSAYARVGYRQQMHRALAQLLVVCGLALVAFGAIGHKFHGPVPSVAFYLWTGAYGLILVSLFWVLATESTDSREARRLFGFIGAGGILGGMAGGAIATFLGGRLGPESTLFVAGAILIAAVPFAKHVVDPASSRILEIPRDEAAPRNWRRDPYVILLSTLFLLSGIGAGVLDYQFKVVVERVSAGDPMQLSRLLGGYYAFLNGLAIVIQVFASGWLLRRFGAVAVSGLLPAGVALGSLAALAQPALPVILAATRMFDAGLRVSVVRTAWEFFYFPLGPAMRRRVKTWIDAVVDRSSEALAGILILALGATHSQSPALLGWIVVLLAILTIALGWRLRDAYVQQLSVNLRTLVADEEQPATPGEARLIEEAHKLLDSPFEKRALYAFELLERADPEGLDVRLGTLQDHPSPAIRARVLGRLADPARPVASPLLENVARDESEVVRTEAFRLYAERFGDADARLAELLGSEDEASRAAALEYFVSRASVPDPVVEQHVDAVLRHGSVAERRSLASGLGRRPRPSTNHARLGDFLRDPVPDVRREALAAAAAAGLRDMVPGMLPLLAVHQTRDAARHALASFGNRVVGTLGDAMVDPATPPAVVHEIPGVLAEIGSQDSANQLLRRPARADLTLRHRVLKAQNRIRTADSGVRFPRATIRAELERDVEAFLRIHVHLDVWERETESRARKLLYSSLLERRETAFAQIFRHLGLVYPPREIYLGYRALRGDARRTRAQALEYLDAALLPEDRRLLVPTLENPDRRKLLAEALYGIKPFTRETSLADLLATPDVWLQACALYGIGAMRLTGLRSQVALALSFEPHIVRETAAWSLARLGDP